jgi:transposase
MVTELLPESVWDEVRPLLPPRPPPSPKGGRPPADDRAALAGILYVARHGVPWQALPTRTFGVSGSSCWRRLRDWTRAGVWPALHRRLLDRLGKAGGVDVDRVAVDSQSVRALRGAERRAQPHGPREKGVRAAPADGRRRRAAGRADRPGRRQRRGRAAGPAGGDARRPRPARAAAAQVYQQRAEWRDTRAFEAAVHDLGALHPLARGRAEQPTAAIIDGRVIWSAPENGGRVEFDGHQ